MKHWLRLMVVACLLLCAGVEGYGQAMERVYADAQNKGGSILGNVTDGPLAVDGNKDTHSKMTITLLGNVWQQLTFTGTLPTGTDPVYVKLGTSTGLLNLLDDVELQAYNGNTPVGNSYTMGSILLGLGLLNGADQVELVIPAPGVSYNRVRITYDGVALGGSINIYEAYFYKPATGAIACDQAADVLYGSTAVLVGGVNSVQDAHNAIDGNPLTYASLHSNVGVSDKTHLTTLYSTLSTTGDSIRVILESPGGGLLDATLLAQNFAIHTYNDNYDNGALDLDPSLLRLRLLPGSTGIQVLTYPITQSFNRIEVSLGQGLAEALGSLRVYEIERFTVGPAIAGLFDGQYEVCDGSPVNLAIDNPQTGYTYQWYTEPIGGSPVATGTSYSPSYTDPGEYIYYVSAIRTGCTTESGRTMVVIKVNESAAAADINVDANSPFCLEDDVVLTPSSTTVTDPVFKWYHDANKTQSITDGTEGAVTYQIAGDGTLTIQGLEVGQYNYYVSVSNSTTCENTAGALKEVTVEVHAPPSAPTIQLTPE